LASGNDSKETGKALRQKAIFGLSGLKALFCLAFCVSWTTAATAAPLSICLEDRFWPPNSFLVEGEPAGTHVAIVQQAFKALPYSITFKAMPWKRCLTAVKRGEVDGILSAAFREDRNTFLHYPPAPSSIEPHPSSLGVVGFAVITNTKTDLTGIKNGSLPPQPIGIPLGYMVVDVYRDRGARVVETANYSELYELLRRGRVKSLVLSEPLADIYAKHGAYRGLFKSMPLPGRSGPLYLGLSRNRGIEAEKISKIWQAIANVRANQKQMQTINAKAQKDAYICLMDDHLCE